ncbi:MAG: hypothetical protein DDT19_00763 [Syntrophomonadaceae bacterium]|nr:hypothetical protein [Bacillota bacterium]
MTASDIELAVADYFNVRVNLIVPNISWGMFLHECDLLIITKNNYAYEVEIKTSKSDLIADQKKRHNHSNKKIKKLYFAIPDDLLQYAEYIPDYAGIVVIGIDKKAKMVRQAQDTGNYKFTAEEKYNVARLGAMRIWNLKKKLDTS